MYGLFFEDINFAADGGLYPELVKNKSFEYDDPLIGWKALKGGAGLEAFQVVVGNPVSKVNKHYLRVEAKVAGPDAGILNEGFRGIGVKAGAEYTLSLFARRGAGTLKGLTIDLLDEKGQSVAQAKLGGLTADWQKQTAVLKPSATVAKGSLRILLDEPGSVDMDVISVFPKATFMNRPNGMRADLAQLLKDMKPGFLRFPGGCIVEGRTLAQRYQWKETIGELADRQPLINRWNTEFLHRFTPDYYQSFGLGFYEYFQLSEDIGAEPLPVLNVGMACQFNSAELVPVAKASGPNAGGSEKNLTLDDFIQDALDLIEFANGPANSFWGAKRVAMGHPAPFNMKFLGIGNEQWGPQYLERYEPFSKAVKAKYPYIQIVSSAGPAPEGELFEKASKQLRDWKAEYIDEHYYAKPEWFRQNVGRYDAYPRTGSKIFAGEYAAQTVAIGSPDNKNNWDAALSEAAFMTGLERNADVVSMASYAPLFAHVEGWQWTPNEIWFDNLSSYGTPNYYVQKTFSLNKGTRILPVALPGNVKNGNDNLFVSAVQDGADVVVKLVNYSANARPVSLNLQGAGKLAKEGKATVMASTDLNTVNSLQAPTNLSPKEEVFAIGSASKLGYTLAPYSFTVLRIPARK